jgi:hypothetical protein
MDHDRRLTLADLAEQHLPELHRAVVASWTELIPAADIWTPEERRRAHSAAEATLRGLVTVIAQGDLDEESWLRTRQVISGRGVSTHQEVTELLRTVRIVGIEVLLARLDEDANLSKDERWAIQQEAHNYCEQLQGTRGEVDPSAVDALFAHLEASGPDLA